ncbi:ribosome small subunit-dependent GTPase A [Candidatus Thiothrix sp. Deng01]|uniref:Small ribosomal subunit biogenesis GTPase RsgA n=1 Tax=Candidatus Thiothrix phosphatis TaxID=3112415 RepID=A0ABU6CWY0_9GAMM|nr:ribosome small subunit-dependent GTPase A [Candidatus Thiothrix sp. Deng01]MEB4591342.1 ribosome small subunit-dependent GTPase A [Candidatus Thiothrix sp. Deng01]
MSITSLHALGWSHFFQAQLTLETFESTLPFRVASVQRNLLECLGFDTQGQLQRLALATYPWRQVAPEQHPTVGDWLLLDKNLEPLQLLERKTLIQRRSAGRESGLQLIAANIDTLLVVSSCNEEFNLNRIERYLALAAEAGIGAVVALTKKDLCPDTSPYLEALHHNHPGLPVETVNATAAQDVARLAMWCASGQTIALLGSSGVGKSTLTNSLTGEYGQETAPIRAKDSKGRHTTTSRSLHPLPGGGVLLDTPGMRELQMVDCEAGVQSVFADVAQLAAQCRFHDCQHVTEPGCAVRGALESGRLEQRRLDNYRKLLAEQAHNSGSVAEKRQQERALGRFYKQAKESHRRFKPQE